MNSVKESIKAKSNNKKTANSTSVKHIQQINNAEGVPCFHCTICQKTFRSRTQQYYHLSCSIATDKKHKCALCKKSFSSRSHLNYHSDTHHSSQTYACNDCGRTFRNAAVLKKHEKLHGNVTLPCEQCGKVFRGKTSLATHVSAQHEHNLPFQCSQCENRYALKSTLQQHMLKHSANQHECTQCGKKFQRNSILKLHMQRHSKAPGFVCMTCLRNFSDMGALMRHSKMHKEIVTKYKCKLCDTSTSRKDNMLRHVRNIHVGEEFAKCVDVEQLNQSTAPNTLLVRDEITFVGVKESAAASFNVPKTVANSSVIKCIGNVQPIKVPTLSHVEIVPSKPKKVKEKYNPIEMYKKILTADMEDDFPLEEQQADDDDDDDETGIGSTVEQSAQVAALNKPIEQQRVNVNSTLNMLNFSEMHWRKNFKYTYEYQDC